MQTKFNERSFWNSAAGAVFQVPLYTYMYLVPIYITGAEHRAQVPGIKFITRKYMYMYLCSVSSAHACHVTCMSRDMHVTWQIWAGCTC